MASFLAGWQMPTDLDGGGGHSKWDAWHGLGGTCQLWESQNPFPCSCTPTGLYHSIIILPKKRPGPLAVKSFLQGDHKSKVPILTPKGKSHSCPGWAMVQEFILGCLGPTQIRKWPHVS